MKRVRCLVVAAFFGFAGASPSLAQADEPAEYESARALFNEASSHFRAGHWAAALAAFQRSHAIVESPNTMLMIARSLRELGRGSDAVVAFERARTDAAGRAARGETKYAPTERAASEEGLRLRAMLGTVHVRVRGREGATVKVDGEPVALDASGDATLLHAPGSATVVVRDPSGAEQRQVVTVLAGSTLDMEFAGDAAPSATTTRAPGAAVSAAPHDDTPKPARPGWVVPAGLVSGLGALAGTGVFIGFGSASHSTFEALDARCGPESCGPAERAQADAGERQQTIANIGLAVAGAATLATLALVVVALVSPGDK